MSKKPNIPHQEIVKYILCGHTTRDAKQHFGFANDNMANLRIYAAFKALGITRPKYAKRRKCQFCGKEFIARDIKQRTCSRPQCQQALIVEWHRKNPEAVRIALKKYRGTEKGRQNNIRTHRRRRERVHGTLQDQWNFAADEIKKSLRKLDSLAYRNPWEYRIEYIQTMSTFERLFTPRNKRRLDSESKLRMWQQALRAIQTNLFQYRINAKISEWEKAVNRIPQALRSGIKVKEWKGKNILSLSIS